MDIHKVTINSGKLYAAGANGDGSVLQRITLDGSGKLTSTIASTPLRGAASASTPAYAGTSVIVAGSSIYALSGNNGGLSVLNTSDLSLRAFTAIPDARDLSLSGNAASVNVVTGKTGSAEAGIKQFDLNGTASVTGNFTLAGAQIDQGKSTIQSGSVAHIVTAGYAGAKLLCTDGTVLGTAANPSVSGLTADKVVANAAAFGGGYMFVANGEAGVSIYSVNTPLIPLGCNLVTITNLGRFSLGGTDASANNVYYSNGYLVVATGKKGFKIIKVTTSVLSGLLQAL